MDRHGTPAVCEDGSTAIYNSDGKATCPELPLVLDKTAGPSCPRVNIAEPVPTANGSNPINSATGNKYQGESDYLGPGSFPLRLVRHYNSRGVGAGPQGYGWTHGYGISIEPVAASSPAQVTLRRSTGQTLAFTQVAGTSTWQGDPDIVAHLESVTGGWRLTESDGSALVFDATGKLVQWMNLHGESQTLTYDGGRLQSVTDAQGRQLRYDYDANGHIANVTLPDDRVIRYGYDSQGNLTQVQYSDQTIRQYRYENTTFPHALTGIIDERGTRYATWTYDAQGRAISSEHAGQDKHTFTFNADGSTMVTNALGKQTTYTFQTLHGVPKIVQVTGHPTASCLGANQAYTYTPEGWLATKTDWNGSVTRYAYDAQGREISRTEAEGTPQARVVTTEWHPTLRLPLKITAPDRITTFTYDGHDRELARTVTGR